MVCPYYALYWFPFLCPVSKWHFSHKEYNKQYPETYLDEIQEWIVYLSTKYVLCRFDNYSTFIDVFKIWTSPGERYSTVAWPDHLLLIRTSVTINEVYSLKCLLEFVSQLLHHRRDKTSSNNQPVQLWSAIVYRRISQKMTGLFGQVPV